MSLITQKRFFISSWLRMLYNNDKTCLRTLLGVILIISILNIAVARGKTIYTSSVKKWTPASLEQLVNECEEGSTIVFDADYDYTIDRCIRPTVSISIKGNGKKLRTINKTNYVISLFDVRLVNSFELSNLIIDGSSDKNISMRTIPKEFFMTIVDVPKVIIDRCVFQNIHTSYPDWKVGDEAYTIWVENYKRFDFTNNKVINCYCPEFLKAILPINNTDSGRIANISGNEMSFFYTSSAVEVRFGRFRINNNQFGITNGSTINAYGFDSEIKGNSFHGAHNSASIDLSEYFHFKYVSHNIKVKNNRSNYSRDGFLIADNVYDIDIKNNVFRADIFNESDHARLDSLLNKHIDIKCDRALDLGHNISNIKIISNDFIGANALMMLYQPGTKRNIRIERNIIRNVEKPVRSSLVLTQVENVLIKNNEFINTGKTFSFMKEPQFIVIGPTRIAEANERYARNITIKGNKFSFSTTESTHERAYVIAHTVYEKNNANTLSTLSNISILNNKATFDADILLVSDVFDSENVLVIKRNSFNAGGVWGNLMPLADPIQIEKGMRVERDDLLEINGMQYYVVREGVVSPSDGSYGADYVIEGTTLLKRVK